MGCWGSVWRFWSEHQTRPKLFETVQHRQSLARNRSPSWPLSWNICLSGKVPETTFFDGFSTLLIYCLVVKGCCYAHLQSNLYSFLVNELPEAEGRSSVGSQGFRDWWAVELELKSSVWDWRSAGCGIRPWCIVPWSHGGICHQHLGRVHTCWAFHQRCLIIEIERGLCCRTMQG